MSIDHFESPKDSFNGDRPPHDWQHDWYRFWQTCREHREVVSQMLSNCAAKNNDTLSVWGTGSCHDLDLDQLTQQFRQINLVDLRRNWIENGIAFQQRISNRSFDNVQVQAPVDLAGVAAAISRSPAHHNRDDRLRDVGQQIAEFRPIGSMEKFSALASTGILSQLVVELAEGLAEQRLDEILEQTIATIRRRHIELMLDHLQPAGHGILIIDFLTSDNLPELSQEPLPAGFDRQIQRAVQAGNHLFGLAPACLQTDMQHPTIISRLKNVQISQVWRWSMLHRSYACYAIRFQAR